MKSEGHTGIWEKSLLGRSSSGPKVGGHLVCFRNVQEDSMDKVQRAGLRVMEVTLESSEVVQSWRALEARIGT